MSAVHSKTGQAEFRARLRLPRRTLYLSRAERGLIAFLQPGAPAAVQHAA